MPKWEITPKEWIRNPKWLYLDATFEIVNVEREWALRRAARFGRERYRIWAKHSLDSPALQRIPRYLIRQAIIQAQISIQTIRVASAEWSGDADFMREIALLEFFWQDQGISDAK